MSRKIVNTLPNSPFNPSSLNPPPLNTHIVAQKSPLNNAHQNSSLNVNNGSESFKNKKLKKIEKL